MIQVFLILLLIVAIFVVAENNFVRMIIYLGIFSLICAVCFLLFAAPDVAMAEAVVSVFSTIIYIVAFEKYYKLTEPPAAKKKTSDIIRRIPHLGFVIVLIALFIWLAPDNAVNTSLKNQYTDLFSHDVGGENAVTAIYLGYRMYDTLFEALMLFVSVIAIMHLSWYKDIFAPDTKHSDIKRSDITNYTIRIISPLLILFGVYLAMNGHISPGGGFQGDVIVAAFFVGRYIVCGLNDIRIEQVITMEKLIYIGIILLTAFFIFSGAHAYLSAYKSIYLIAMNLLIGMKVACGFFIIFYRFIALERR